MADLHLLRPWWLLALPPAIGIWWGLWRQRNAVASWSRTIDGHLLKHLLVGKQKRARVRPIHLLLILWIFSLVALAGPSWQREPSPFADDQAGLVVLLRASGSMNATDVQPSRLERAKHKLRDLVELRQGASTGLIVYSGSAHTVMPLTRDDRVITTMIQELSPELMPVEGDALVSALKLAEELLSRAGVAGSVLVITDSVSGPEVDLLEGRERGVPTQFLAVQAPFGPVDAGIERAASTLRAPLVRLAADQKDVEALARGAQTRIRAAPALQTSDRWRDEGYALVPLIALCTLPWCRRGWVVR